MFWLLRKNLREWLNRNIHAAPFFLAAHQAIQYMWFFTNPSGYVRFMPLLDHLAKDSFYVLAFITIYNRNWYVDNVLSMVSLWGLWIVNLVAVVYGIDMGSYFLWVVCALYLLHLRAIISFLCNFPHYYNNSK